ncbi:Alpha/Beta hydrolase protein [Dactylonectria macrodidyma]|uniref:Alpha/Beta hydrolase protein n=1 Tax=Dactylonectria macrodidyma TaxID=307937 RepID=A0A9P9I8A6_9HYPO|nr:Alpha/Beta hydrolase protein [Dactylonectria macrodidyma]
MDSTYLSKQPYLPGTAAALEKAPDLDPWKSPQDVIDSRPFISKIMDSERDAILSDPNLVIQDRTISGPQGDIIISIITHKTGLSNQTKRPSIFYVHGGGMVAGDRFLGLSLFIPLVKSMDVVLLTVEYRLAPEHPGLALVTDAYAALSWFAEHTEELGVNPAKIIVAGSSAGGGIAAGTVLMARDRGGPQVAAQMLQTPMLDDRNTTVSAQHYESVRGAYSSANNKIAWLCVLGDKVGQEDVSYYIAPARAKDLSRLPITYVDVGGAEPFRDEAINYALRLSQCGVLTDLHVWGGCFHGFEMVSTLAIAKSSTQTKYDWLTRILTGTD